MKTLDGEDYLSAAAATASPTPETAVRVALGTPATIIVAIAAGIARLPEEADISTPRSNGVDLEFVQPDGTLIVIANGAIADFALYLGAVEIPPDALAALLAANGIETAAGPAASPGAHGGYESLGPQSVGDPDLSWRSLLDDSGDLSLLTSGADAPSGGDVAPIVLSSTPAHLSEAGLSERAGFDTTVTGAVVVSDIGPLSFTFGVPSGTLTSGGIALVWRAAGGTLVATAGSAGPTIITATISATGTYTITLSGPLDHAPGQGENDLALAIPVVVTDTGGLSASTGITLTVTDDIPASTDESLASLAEDNATGVDGNVLGNDSQGADGAAMARVTLDGGATWTEIPSTGATITAEGVGAYSFARDGSWSFVPVADFFGAAGFGYVLVDFDGDESAVASQPITVTPVNDAPVITAADGAGTFGEDQVLTTTGSLTVADIDSSALTTSVYVAGMSGAARTVDLLLALQKALTLSPTSLGSSGTVDWSFTVDAGLLQYLGAGQSVTVTYRIRVNDGNLSDTQDVKITLTGSNDAPVISAVDVGGEFGEDQALATAGSITVADIDSSSFMVSASLVGTSGVAPSEGLLVALQNALTVSPTVLSAPGAVGWSFEVASDLLQYLGVGQSITVTYRISVSDGDLSDTQAVSVTLTGSNDAPVITAADGAGTFGEDQVLATTGSLTVADTDSSALTTSVYVAGMSGAARTVDLLLALQKALTLSPTSLGSSGTVDWSFTVDAGLLQYLGAGQSVTVTYRIRVNDGNLSDTQDVKITLTGSNDAPVISAVDVGGSVVENGALTASGSVNVADVDGADPTVSAALLETRGATPSEALMSALHNALSLSQQPGQVGWSFAIANSLISYLGGNETITVTYRITASDGLASDTEDVTITISGAAEPPIADADSFSASEAAVQLAGSGSPIALGSVLDGDTDPGGLPLAVTGTSNWRFNELDAEMEVHSVGATGNRYRIWTQDGGVAIVEVAANGSVTLWAESGDPFRWLGIGQTCSVTFDYTVSNGQSSTTASATITITGTNDGPVARGYFVEINEDTGISGSATVIDLDDAGRANLTVELISGPAHAQQFTLRADGTYEYSPQANYNGTDSFTYRVRDAQGLWSEPATFEIRVLPVEDTPQAWIDNGNSDPTFRMTEDDADKTFNQLANDRLDGDGETSVEVNSVGIDYNANHPDIDASDVRVTVDENNQLKVELVGDDWDQLQAGETAGIRVTYTLHGDKPGQTSTAQMILQVAGVNDAPVLDASLDQAMETRVNAAAPVNGLTQGTAVSDLLAVTDMDGYAGGMAVTGLDASHGDWYYSMDDGAAWLAIDAASLSDAHALLLRPEYRLSFQPDAGYSTTIADAITFRAWDTTSGVAGGYGDTRSNGGTTAYSSATETADITFVSANDVPVLAAIAQPAAIAEVGGTGAQAIAPISGTLTVTDLDFGNPLVANVAGKASVQKNGTTIMIDEIQSLDEISALTFTTGVASNGAATTIGWTYYPGSAAFDFLGAGDTLRVTYTVLVSDGVGYSNTQTLTFEFTGTNDAPVVSSLGGDTVGFTEGGVAAALDRFANASVTDVDNADFRGGSLTVAISGNGVAGEDVLSVAAGGSVAISGNSITVRVDGIWREVATVSGGTNGTPLVLSLTQYATPAATAALIQALRYANTNGDDPNTAARTVTVALNDGDGGISTSTVTVAVTGLNDAPVMPTAAGGTVAENQAGAVVGTITVEDVDNPTDLAFAVFGADGQVDTRFEVLPTGGISKGEAGTYEVRLKAGQSLDFETENADGNPSIILRVEVKDPLIGNYRDSKTITVSVTDAYENVAPVLASTDPRTYSFESGLEGWQTLGLAARASVDGDYAVRLDTDSTTGNPAALEQALDLPVGTLVALAEWGTSGAAQWMEQTLQVGQTVTFSWYFETFDEFPAEDFYDVAFFSANGTVYKLSSIDQVGGNGNSGWMTFTFTAPVTGTYTLGFGVLNVGDDQYNSRLYVDDITISAAPVELTPSTEGDGDPSGAVGTLVSDFVGLMDGTAADNVTDGNGDPIGLALTGTNAANGTWWYSLDSGQTWLAVGSVTDATALLLSGDDWLYFEPAAGYSGSVADAITFRAWDQSTGAGGNRVDTTSNGGATAYSSTEATVSLEVLDTPGQMMLLDSDGIDLSVPPVSEPITFTLDDLVVADLLADYDYDRGDFIDLSALLDGVDVEVLSTQLRYEDNVLSIDTDGAGPGEFVAVAELPAAQDHLRLLLDGGLEMTITEMGAAA